MVLPTGLPQRQSFFDIRCGYRRQAQLLACYQHSPPYLLPDFSTTCGHSLKTLSHVDFLEFLAFLVFENAGFHFFHYCHRINSCDSIRHKTVQETFFLSRCFTELPCSLSRGVLISYWGFPPNKKFSFHSAVLSSLKEWFPYRYPVWF